MAYVRGKYGVEYTPQPASGRRNHHLRWLLICLVVLVAVPIFVARSRRSERPPVMTLEQPKVLVPETPPAVVGVEPRQAPPKPEQASCGKAETEKPQAAPPPPPKPPRKVVRDSPFAAKVDGWIGSRTWSRDEQELLVMLRDAERQGNVPGARGAIERLMYRPQVEDLKDQFVRRLGELNMQLLFSGTNTPWTATVTVKRGDTLQRIAANHRTTQEALLRLNPMKDPNRLALGQTLRVLNFPDVDLVVHKQLQFADLMLKKRIFKRYYVTVKDDAATGSLLVANESGARASDHLRALMKQIAPVDRDELRLFLAPGSRITVTAQ